MGKCMKQIVFHGLVVHLFPWVDDEQDGDPSGAIIPWLADDDRDRAESGARLCSVIARRETSFT